MDDVSQLIGQLKSSDKNRRYDACEELRVSSAISVEALHALVLFIIESWDRKRTTSSQSKDTPTTRGQTPVTDEG